jgi:hypothetical protein
MSSIWTTDPKYNGEHVCPKCKAPSQWTAKHFETRTIKVECSGRCGTYEDTYSNLTKDGDY